MPIQTLFPLMSRTLTTMSSPILMDSFGERVRVSIAAILAAVSERDYSFKGGNPGAHGIDP
jgi:hypothetical protein